MQLWVSVCAFDLLRPDEQRDRKVPCFAGSPAVWPALVLGWWKEGLQVGRQGETCPEDQATACWATLSC